LTAGRQVTCIDQHLAAPRKMLMRTATAPPDLPRAIVMHPNSHVHLYHFCANVKVHSLLVSFFFTSQRCDPES
jgi:hypothetical protein